MGREGEEGGEGIPLQRLLSAGLFRSDDGAKLKVVSMVKVGMGR